MDERLLLHHYTIITPAYSQSFIRALLSDEAHPLRQYLSTTSLLQFDHKLLQIHTLEAVIGRKNASFHVGSILPELMQSVPSRRTNIPGFSTTMLFTYNYFGKSLMEKLQEHQHGLSFIVLSLCYDLSGRSGWAQSAYRK